MGRAWINLEELGASGGPLSQEPANARSPGLVILVNVPTVLQACKQGADLTLK